VDEISVFLKYRGRELTKTRKKAIFTLLLSRFGLKTRIIFLSYVGNDIRKTSSVSQVSTYKEVIMVSKKKAVLIGVVSALILLCCACCVILLLMPIPGNH